MHTTDPVELMIADGLRSRGIRFTHESENKAQGLDFYLPDLDLLIEVKQYSSDRTGRQIAGRENVVLVQGKPAARAFLKLIGA